MDPTYPPCSEMTGSRFKLERRRLKSHWPDEGCRACQSSRSLETEEVRGSLSCPSVDLK